MIYVDGFVAPVASGITSAAYAAFAEKAATIFREHGATRVVDCWADDVPDGLTIPRWSWEGLVK